MKSLCLIFYIKNIYIGIFNTLDYGTLGILISVLAFCMFSKAIVYQKGLFKGHESIAISYATVFSSLFTKLKSIDLKALSFLNSGELTNNLTNDIFRIYGAVLTGRQIVNSPIIIILYLTAIGYFIGVYMLAGLGIVFLFLGFLICISRLCAIINFKKLLLNDKRNKELAFILEGIQNVKLNTWEKIIEERILSIRNQEKKLIFKIQFLRALNEVLTFVLPSLGSFVCILLYNSIETPMNLETAFFIITVFNLLAGPLKLFYYSTTSLFECIKSVKRIELILALPDAKKPINTLKPIEINGKTHEENKDLAIYMKDACFSFKNSVFENLIFEKVKKIQGVDAKQSNLIKQNAIMDTGFTLKNLNLKIKKGQLIMIVGKVGSGKSCLLKSTLDMLHQTNGNIQICGSIAYIPQESFLINDTIRENILFGFDFDSDRYKKTILLSQLKPDLKVLPGGEFTEIGEHGLNLSGGQKQRVSIARAYYSNSDIYLVDDALSALDYHVGKSIFEDLIVKNIKKKKKTILMVSHLLQYLEMADSIIFMEDGMIKAQGNYRDLIDECPEFSEFVMEKENKNINSKNHKKIEKQVSKFNYIPKTFDEYFINREISVNASNYSKKFPTFKESAMIDDSIHQLIVTEFGSRRDISSIIIDFFYFKTLCSIILNTSNALLSLYRFFK